MCFFVVAGFFVVFFALPLSLSLSLRLCETAADFFAVRASAATGDCGAAVALLAFLSLSLLTAGVGLDFFAVVLVGGLLSLLPSLLLLLLLLARFLAAVLFFPLSLSFFGDGEREAPCLRGLLSLPSLMEANAFGFVWFGFFAFVAFTTVSTSPSLA